MKGVDKIETAGFIFMFLGLIMLIFKIKVGLSVLVTGVICIILAILIKYINSQTKLKEKKQKWTQR
jgi:hypothetical protein